MRSQPAGAPVVIRRAAVSHEKVELPLGHLHAHRRNTSATAQCN
jgi:hypothetical protein